MATTNGCCATQCGPGYATPLVRFETVALCAVESHGQRSTDFIANHLQGTFPRSVCLGNRLCKASTAFFTFRSNTGVLRTASALLSLMGSGAALLLLRLLLCSAAAVTPTSGCVPQWSPGETHLRAMHRC
jgi:hypothetical protein